ncbi:hypothetical protein ABT354_09250 [Streptomyces sp. NPDC000594]|uniref:hypothetical protein n=1 Tax=Streptomyces sp. NPDC000594 TaxID=3154261 RepID=UPI00331C8BE4
MFEHRLLVPVRQAELIQRADTHRLARLVRAARGTRRRSTQDAEGPVVRPHDRYAPAA